jgi:hypothetical protein
MSDALLPTSMPLASEAAQSAPTRPIRVWFPAALAVLFLAAYVAIGALDVLPQYIFFGRLIGVGVWWLLFLGWWLFQRRVPRRERWAVLGGMFAVIIVIFAAMDQSVRDLALMAAFYAVPAQLLGWTAWLAMKGKAPNSVRRNGMLAIALLAWAWIPLLRMDGLSGQGDAVFHWRWAPTGEEAFLAAKPVEATLVSADAQAPAAEPIVAVERRRRHGRYDSRRLAREAAEGNLEAPRRPWLVLDHHHRRSALHSGTTR